jgi:TRAP-type mannitol/chloroaromatic compound transport system substrate-binding protein
MRGEPTSRPQPARVSPAARPVGRRHFLEKAASAVGLGVFAGCEGSAGEAAAGAGTPLQGPEVTWTLATSFPPSLDLLHGTAERMAERVSTLTGGRFQIRVYAANEVVPALQVMDAVEQGSVQAGYTPGYFYSGKSAALAFDTAVPFGLTASQQSAWLYQGGGLELMRGVYADFGIVNFPAGNTGAQFGGWFRRPVESLSDLGGLRMRIPGMGGEVMSRLGVSVQVLGGADIYPALERGAIDATEWVGPYDDEKLGFHEIAPYYYYPGWWEPGPNVSLLVSRGAYDQLPEGYRQVLETVSREATLDELARYDAANPAALDRLVREHGVTLRPFSQEILEASWRASAEHLEEQAARDATFRRVHDAWKTFRDHAFPFAAGNEQAYATFAFGRVEAGARR